MTRDELKAIRKSYGLTQAAFADDIGLSTRAIEEIEAGRAEVRQIHLNAVLGFMLRVAPPEGTPMPEYFRQYVHAAARRVD